MRYVRLLWESMCVIVHLRSMNPVYPLDPSITVHYTYPSPYQWQRTYLVFFDGIPCEQNVTGRPLPYASLSHHFLHWLIIDSLE